MTRAMLPTQKEKIVAVFILALFFLPGFSGPLFAGDRKVDGAVTLYPGMGPIRESDAYKQFAMRPVTEYSKLLYLIDRFGTIDADILYDGMHYRTGWVAAFARGFLARSYRNEKAADWVMKWCNRGVLKGELIWAEFPNKKLQLGRLVLLDELKGLEAAIKDLPVKEQAAPEKK
jgi:hypothetical protein